MLNPGTILQNRYLIQAQLGQGGMGSVYRAFDQTMNRVVAIKERVPDPNAAPQAIAQARQQFQREAQVLGALSHPGLPHIHDFFSVGGNEYVVMELIEGEPLDKIIAQHGAINEGAVRAWADQVLDALMYIHSRNVIHRDIKPANLILKPGGKVVLVDFGLVKLVDPNNPYTATAMRGLGTAGYAPLEQFSAGMHTDVRSDIYALGATLYHLLSGQMPVDVPQRVADPNALPSLRAVNPNISPVMDAVVQKAMSVRALDRFQSVAEMRQALNTRSQPAPTVPVYTPPPRPQSAPPSYVAPTRPARNSGSTNWGKIFIGLVVPLFISGVIGIGALMFLVLAQPVPTPALTAAPRATAAPPTAAPTPTLASTALPEHMVGGALMVNVPVGDFTMGSNDVGNDAKPIHIIYLDSFWIDKFETTNALYKKCADAGKCSPPSDKSSSTRSVYYGNAAYDNYPVIYVSWDDASKYCAWAGKRLPTEAEWEKAARGTDGRTYPWGNSFDKNLLNSSEGGKGDTTAVGSYPGGASPYGTLDMAGNVWEWVKDGYSDNYYASSPRNNPLGPIPGPNRVFRGGSWTYIGNNARAALRYYNFPGIRYNDLGFRCAQ